MRAAFNVRSRAPLRIGLAGGGTDLSPYCDQYGGNVLNATIDRFAYAHIKPSEDRFIRFHAYDIGQEEILVPGVEIDINSGLMLHRAVYWHVMQNFCNGEQIPLSISTTIDVPAGSGLGASSALVVALIEAFRTALQLPLGLYDVARLAFDIERIHLGLAGGRQDQYAAAFGGVNFIEFLAGERVIVNPLRMRRDFLNEFESSLTICFTGQSRRSDTIIKQQVTGLKEMADRTVENMHQMKQDASEMKIALLHGNFKEVARILAHSWLAKKMTAADISNKAVEYLHDTAMSVGAWAGKVSGAGGGGFLMIISDPEDRHRLIETLNSVGGQASAVKLTFDGAEGWSVGR